MGTGFFKGKAGQQQLTAAGIPLGYSRVKA